MNRVAQSRGSLATCGAVVDRDGRVLECGCAWIPAYAGKTQRSWASAMEALAAGRRGKEQPSHPSAMEALAAGRRGKEQPPHPSAMEALAAGRRG